MPKHYHPTPPGWIREYQYGRGIRFVHRATGRCVMRPINSKNWYVYGSDGTRSEQWYRTWIDAVQDASKSSRKEQTT